MPRITKSILILLILFNLQVKAQNVNWCDSIFIYGGFVDNNDTEPIHIEIWNNQANNFTFMVGSYNSGWYDIVLYGNIIAFYNHNPSTNLPYDTITIRVDYTNEQDIPCNCSKSFYSIQDNWNRWWYPLPNITYIKEITSKTTNNNTYDLFGREIVKPKGLYIKNNKLYYVR